MQSSSVTDFVASQSEHRNQYIFTVKTTLEQDEKISGYLKSQKDNVGYLDNCAVRTYTSLVQGGVAPGDMQAPTPAALMQVMLGLVQGGKASVSVVEKN